MAKKKKQAEEAEVVTDKPEKTQNSESGKTETSFMQRFMSMSGQKGGIQPELAQKINSTHITKALDIAKDTNRKVHLDGIYDRVQGIVIMLVILMFLVFVIVFLTKNDNVELLENIIQYMIVGGGGFGLGYGYRYIRDK